MTKLIIILLFCGWSTCAQIGQNGTFYHPAMSIVIFFLFFPEVLQLIQQGFEEYIETQLRPDYLDVALSQFQLTHFFRTTETLGNTVQSTLTSDVACNLCSIVASFLVDERKLGMSSTGIMAEAQTICELLDIETPRVCNGTIYLNAVR